MNRTIPRRFMHRLFVLALLFSITAATAPPGNRENALGDSIRKTVDATIPALMAKDHIPGMAVAVTVAGRAYVFNYGVASTSPRTPVTDATLFELGSVTKTFTATLAAWAHVQQRLSLADTTAKYVPDFQGTPFGSVKLLNLGTHTPGGLPLQFPDDVTNDTQMMQFFERWRPAYAMGTYRTYANPGIAMLGFITARSMGEDFRSLIQQGLLPALGLKHTFIAIPANELAQYAWGYTDEGKPIRMTAGVLSDEAYGIRTTATDMIRFVQENIDPSRLPSAIQQAIAQTHTGYFQAGPMTQDLIWEQYPYPVALPSLLEGNGYKMIFQPTPVTAIAPPQAPMQNVWLNKTGSTNGFGAYVAFVPSQRLGIVLLANKNYPIPDRVTAAYHLMRALAGYSVISKCSTCSGKSKRKRGSSE
jgi:beta-lactamase class C